MVGPSFGSKGILYEINLKIELSPSKIKDTYVLEEFKPFIKK